MNSFNIFQLRHIATCMMNNNDQNEIIRARKRTMFRVLELFTFRVSAYKFAFKYILVLDIITHAEFY